MAMQKKSAFSRRLPDLVTEELLTALMRRTSYEFHQIFDIVHENLRARNAASGGEEMLRLRAYEKLQNLVARGLVKKELKKYRGLPAAITAAREAAVIAAAALPTPMHAIPFKPAPVKAAPVKVTPVKAVAAKKVAVAKPVVSKKPASKAVPVKTVTLKAKRPAAKSSSKSALAKSGK